MAGKRDQGATGARERACPPHGGVGQETSECTKEKRKGLQDRVKEGGQSLWPEKKFLGVNKGSPVTVKNPKDGRSCAKKQHGGRGGEKCLLKISRLVKGRRGQQTIR